MKEFSPDKRILNRLPLYLGGFVFKIGRLYDQPGQVCDVNERGGLAGGWANTAFLLKAENDSLFYGRPALKVRDRHQRLVEDTGIIIDVGRALAGESAASELTVGLPGRNLEELVVGEACPWPEAGETTTEWLMTMCAKDLEFGGTPPNYPVDDRLSEIHQTLRELKTANTLWEIGTSCLQSLGRNSI